MRINRGTLQLLGNPEYIQFLVNAGICKIAVRRSYEGEPLSLKTHWSFLNDNGQSCEFYSKNLMKSLCGISSAMERGHTYRRVGTLIDKNNLIEFDMTDFLLIEDISLSKVSKK